MIAMNALQSGVSQPVGAAMAPASSVSPLARAVRSVGNSVNNQIPRVDGDDLVGNEPDAQDMAYSAQASIETAQSGFPANLHAGSNRNQAATETPRPEAYSAHICHRAEDELFKGEIFGISQKLKKEYEQIIDSWECRAYLGEPPRLGKR